MARIEPFRGLLYRISQPSDLTQLVTPPYDVIPADRRRALAASHPHNFVHLILPQAEGTLDAYAHAARLLGEWRRDGVLVQDERPSLTLHRQSYVLEDGRRITRSGLIGLLPLPDSPNRQVLSHETTFSGPRRDRERLMAEVEAHLSPIFMLAPDTEGRLEAEMSSTRTPGDSFTDEDGIRHEVAVLSDPELVEQLCAVLGEGDLIIADGHHRYESARAVHDKRRAAAGPGDAGVQGAGRILVEVVSLASPGLTVLPTHRLVAGLDGFDPEEFLARLARGARLEALPARGPKPADILLEKLQGAAPGSIGLVLPTAEPCHLVEMPCPTPPPTPVDALPVALLHKGILEGVLGLGTDGEHAGGTVSYTRDAGDALDQVATGRAQMAFLLRPTSIAELLQVTAAGLRMPQKSTYFYPKVPSGLVVHSF
jgi:uncharacterized protein (DUF1015 family)